MGNFNTKQNAENWNDINTEDISSTIPYMSGMNKESTDLANVLTNYLNTDTESEQNNTTFMKKYNVNNNEQNERTSTELSATSPFITSELYKKMVQTKNMEGGGKDDSSSTSTTSDYEQKQSSVKKVLTANSDISTRESAASRGEFSYQSSSAHTGGNLSTDSAVVSPPEVEDNNSETNIDITDSPTEEDKSDEDKSEKENKSEEDPKIEETSEVNVSTIENDNSPNESDKQATTSSEIKTSDINMVSINTE